MKILPIILSGGSGTRLWPLSRKDYPKQLHKLCGDLSLLQETAQRLRPDPDILPPIIICGEPQRFMVADQLQEIGVAPAAIILEPVARSTAPALAIPAIWSGGDEDTVLVAMPADHYIDDTESFTRDIKDAAKLAMDGTLMTLGIKPTSPHVGFGYIKQGNPLPHNQSAFSATSFKEKPDEVTAQSYLDAGKYFWNAGIFVIRADIYLQELKTYQPEILAACYNAFDRSQEDLDFLRLDQEAFAQSPSLSVDYAIMEKSYNVCVLPASFAWRDIGGWEALWGVTLQDEDGNVALGDVLNVDTRNSYIRSDNRLVTTIGLDNMIVVDSDDALLVAQKDKADQAQEIVTALRKENRSEANSHRRVWRPWGYYDTIAMGENFCVKKIIVKAGGKLSLQTHQQRSEHWVVVSGQAAVTIGDEERLLNANESLYIPQGTKHRLANAGAQDLVLIEVQSGDYIGEDDIVRHDDVYQRD